MTSRFKPRFGPAKEVGGGDWAAGLHIGLLRAFIVVADLKSVTGAARALSISPSVVSTQLTTLARMTGLPLTERRGGEIALTPAGKEVYEAARCVVQAASSLRDVVAQVHGDETVELTAVGSRFAFSYLVPAFIAPFLQANPQVRFWAQCVPTHQIPSQIAIGNADIAFVSERPALRSPLTFKQLVIDRFCLILPPEAPLAKSPTVTVSDLTQLSYMLFPQGRRTRMTLEERLGPIFSRLKVIGEIDSMLAIMNAVKAGLCAGFVPMSIATDANSQGSLVARDIEGIDLTRRMGLVIDPERVMSPGLECFLNYLDNQPLAKRDLLG